MSKYDCRLSYNVVKEAFGICRQGLWWHQREQLENLLGTHSSAALCDPISSSMLQL